MLRNTYLKRAGFRMIRSIILCCLAMAMAGMATGKSAYVVGNLNASPTPILAYNILADGTLNYQATHNIPYASGGAVGMAIDADNGMLFVVYEFSNIIQIIDASTMTSVGTATMNMTGSYYAAGIVYNHVNKHLYAVQRTSNTVFEYSWDPVNLVLTNLGQHTLTGASLFGLALDEVNGLLYATSNNNYVQVWDISTWTLQTTINTPYNAIGVAVDPLRNYMYTGGAWNGSNNYLTRYDLTTSTFTHINVASLPGGATSQEGAMGIAVDHLNGYVYITTGYQGDCVRAFDVNLNQIDYTGDIGDPTAIVIPSKSVGYNPLNLVKTDNLATGACASAGGNITYTICYDNTKFTTATAGVVLTDALPAGVTYVSATPAPSTISGQTLTWNIGTLAAGAAQACINVMVSVNAGTYGSLVNNATISATNIPATTMNTQTFVGADIGTVVLTDVTCNGLSDGAIDISVNGNGPFAFLWSNAATTEDIGGLAAGTYTVNLTDVWGCAATGTYLINEPPPLLADAGPGGNVCAGSSLMLGGTPSASGGIAPYVYSWTPAGDLDDATLSNPMATPTAATTYVLTVMDANLCAATSSAAVGFYPQPSVDAGPDQTVYYGYAPAESATLTATPSGGTAPYTYLWSDGSMTASITVSPLATTNYTVVVTDANGCSASDVVTVNFMDIRCGKKLNKVLICHIPPGNPGNLHTLCVSPNAVPDHLSHGDYLGPCLSSPRMMGGDDVLETFMTMHPNPAASSTHVEFTVADDGDATVMLFDVLGKYISTLYTTEAEGGIYYAFDLDVSGMQQGIYFLKLQTGKEVQMSKLIISH